MRLFCKWVFIAISLLMPITLLALTFPLSKQGNSVVGQMHKVLLTFHDNLTHLGEKYGVGYFEIQEANPQENIDSLTIGKKLIIPSRFILPNVPHQGIVINLPELRLYYYPKNKPVVMTFPIGIGRKRSETPLMTTKIIDKQENPIWRPTADTHKEAKEKGVVLPKYVEAGPDNPLGDFAMRLGIPVYLIHGTNDPTGVGIRSSGGCIRMYPQDVKKLYSLVKIGTPVRIIDEIYKIGWQGKNLMLEAHVPLNHKQGRSFTERNIKELTNVIMPKVSGQHVEIDWDKALRVARNQLGIPAVIGHRR